MRAGLRDGWTATGKRSPLTRVPQRASSNKRTWSGDPS